MSTAAGIGGAGTGEGDEDEDEKAVLVGICHFNEYIISLFAKHSTLRTDRHPRTHTHTVCCSCAPALNRCIYEFCMPHAAARSIRVCVCVLSVIWVQLGLSISLIGSFQALRHTILR